MTRVLGVVVVTLCFAGISALSAGPGPSGRTIRQAGPLGVQELAPGVRLEIVELKRVTGDLVHLSFAVINETDEEVNPRTWGIVANLDHLLDCACGVSLLDLANLKRHRAGNSNNGRRGTLSVAPQSRKEYWAQYQAPPADVTMMTIQIPDARPFYDVPVEGR